MPLPLTYSWRNLSARKGSALGTVAGIAVAVLVFVVISATAEGIKRTAAVTGREGNVLVLARGASSVEASKIPRQTATVLKYLPEVARSPGGEPLASIEAVLLRAIPRVGADSKSGEQSRYTTIRGVTDAAFAVRPEVRLVEGRLPAAPGEVIVGRLLPVNLGKVGLGDTLAFGRQPHRVVGVFEAAGQIYEGEIWVDLEDLLSEMDLRQPSIAVLSLAEPRRMTTFIARLESSKRFAVDAKPEREYFKQAARASAAFAILGNIIGVILGLGAVFAGMNTMYAAMSRRVREIGTLRALGFSKGAVASAFVFESLLLSLLAGALGLLGSWAFDGAAVGLFQLAFRLDVGAASLLRGLALALAIGLFGGLLPARTASRLEIVEALRAL